MIAFFLPGKTLAGIFNFLKLGVFQKITGLYCIISTQYL